MTWPHRIRTSISSRPSPSRWLLKLRSKPAKKITRNSVATPSSLKDSLPPIRERIFDDINRLAFIKILHFNFPFLNVATPTVLLGQHPPLPNIEQKTFRCLARVAFVVRADKHGANFTPSAGQRVHINRPRRRIRTGRTHTVRLHGVPAKAQVR